MAAPRALFAAIMLLSVSCAHSPESATAGTPKAARDKDVISREELQDPVLIGMDALRAIRFLRPSFFRESGPQSFMNSSAGTVQFSMDFGPLLPLSQLAALPGITLQTVYEVRYLDASGAATRFGLNANGGPVIVVVSNKQ
jgi:hypothetical protein